MVVGLTLVIVVAVGSYFYSVKRVANPFNVNIANMDELKPSTEEEDVLVSELQVKEHNKEEKLDAVKEKRLLVKKETRDAKEKEDARLAQVEIDRKAEEHRQAEQQRIAKEEAEKQRVAQANKENTAQKSSQDVASAETGNSTTPNRGGSRGSLIGTFEATAYCNCSICCGKYAGGKTASGTMPQVGHTIAVDPNVIPLGSTVEVNGVSYVAEDTGSAVKGNIIDIYHGSHSEALSFGRQSVEVYRR